MSGRRAWHIARSLTPVSVNDTAADALELFARQNADALPVADENGITGYVTRVDVVALCGGFTRLLADGPPAGHARCEAAVRPFRAIVRGDASIADLARSLEVTGDPIALVIGEGSQVIGSVLESHLLEARSAVVRLPMVGGMATPFGVYLGAEGVSGGVGFWALVSTGVFMGAALLLADGLSQWVLQRLAHAVFPQALLNAWASMDSGFTDGARALFDSGVFGTLLALLCFFLIIRLSPLAGYHAAEHQTVHTLEAQEPLTTERVRRKPRVHPRCGTNLMVTLVLASLLLSAVSALQPMYPAFSESLLEIGVIIIFLFRLSLGGFVQHVFTTRPASEAQIRSGIHAAEELMVRYASAPSVSHPLWRRAWAMGIAQIGLGVASVSLVVSGAGWLFQRLSPVLGSPHLAWLGLAR
ncbi:MAG: DUF1385 domain-containing protein [Chloroflexi bacterium]|nr:DUF1385 domain-containing protein [Chloroflexota bacterium]